jgi:putative N6-adenine-specific DNA methylase
VSADGAPFDAYVIATPGLEQIVTSELRELGIQPGEQETGGVSFQGTLRDLWRVNLHSRTASRVIVRLGAFRVRALGELERRAARLPWERFVQPGTAITVRVTSRKSRLYHTGAVAQRIASGAALHMRGNLSVSAPGDGEDADATDAQLVIVRLLHDECVISVDSSGALLHRRGYRLATARAPMRETLAAAMLLAIGYRGREPLADPMCGAGTIPIEAALLARQIPPGARRDFAFGRWPDFPAAAWERDRSTALGRAAGSAPFPILAADRDAGAIEATGSNADRAGVSADLELRQAALSAFEPPPGDRGWIVTNPPYGVRVGEEDRLRDLYARFGQVVRERCRGWRVAMVSSGPALPAATGLDLREVLRTTSGGLPIRVLASAPETVQAATFLPPV